MSWKDILKEDDMFQEVQREYIDFVEEVLKKISEEDLGFPMYAYFDGLMPEYVKDSEELKEDIKGIIEDYPNNPYIDTKELKRMFDKLNQKENLRNLIDSLRD
tara:strand:+ start:5196 stop:5504 length:309 start_codon:yes stop_codon:yes gene_type:complete